MAAAGEGRFHWGLLWIAPRARELAERLTRRAEASGFRALIVTLDAHVTSWRPRDLILSSFPQLRGHALANYFCDPIFRSRLQRPPEEDLQTAVAQ
jgi:lactate 2-monooxygenase